MEITIEIPWWWWLVLTHLLAAVVGAGIGFVLTVGAFGNAFADWFRWR